jgi:broad specificity phosphatase PhoE
MRKVLLLVIAAAVCAASPSAQSPNAPVTTVVIVRHAEAVPNAGNDPVLSDAGVARANALAAALKDAGVAAVFTTQYQRTALTGQPVAAAANVAVAKATIAGGPAGLDSYVKQTVADVLAKYAGRTVVIVGHSNTVPALVKGFTGADVGEIAHDSYDQMFVISTSAAGAGRVVRARYGAGPM